MTAVIARPRGVAWAREHLFRNRRDSVVTVFAALLTAFVLYRAARFVFVTGKWEVIRVNLTLFLVGRYPRDELWRVVVALVSIGATGGLIAGAIARRRATALAEAGEAPPQPSVRDRALVALVRYWPVVALVGTLLALSRTATPWLVVAGLLASVLLGRIGGAVAPRGVGRLAFVLPAVLPFVLLPLLTAPLGWDGWGGLMLTLLLASVSMLASFPLGVLLALGRRSSLRAIRVVCVGFIEFFRGIPLVVLVLMSAVALGFFFPQGVLPGKVVRVMVAFSIFTAAYVAEIVRGGLQSVPRGQIEAAQALGLSTVRTTALVVLPQALRNVIPSLVGQFISLFKDTSLVSIIGFLEILSVGRIVTEQREFQGDALIPETLAFGALLFWVGAFTLSRESQRLERRLGVGSR